MTAIELQLVDVIYNRILRENDIELVNEMLYVYGCIEFDVVKARIRRRNNREYIRNARVKFIGGVLK